MSGIEAAVAAKVRQWALYADEDLRLARHALTLTTGCPYRLIAYHAQQCAEKYLKFFLVAAGIDFPYTHNVSRLLELYEEQATWPESLGAAEELTPFVITTRYPGVDAEIEIAAVTREAVCEALRSRGATLEELDEPPSG